MLSWSAPTLPPLARTPPSTPPSNPPSNLTSSLTSYNGQLDNTTSPELGLQLDTEQQSWVASLLNFGAFTAGPISGTESRDTRHVTRDA